ncbi:hypothetical protein C0J52_03612 [Blattella germanica]|nr:hypothetical protein C0J52_03612 [Blattella germanica]
MLAQKVSTVETQSITYCRGGGLGEDGESMVTISVASSVHQTAILSDDGLEGSEAIHTRMETTSTKVICQQMDGSPSVGTFLEQSTNIQTITQESDSFTIEDLGDNKGMSAELLDKQDIERKSISENTIEQKDLRNKFGGVLVEEIQEDGVSKSPSIQEINNKLSAGVLIEEPTSDTDMDEQQIKRHDALSVSRGVSIVSITSDDEGSSGQKASFFPDVSADEPIAAAKPQSMDVGNLPQKGESFELSESEEKKPERQMSISDASISPQKGKLTEKQTAEAVESNEKEVKAKTAAGKKAKRALSLETGGAEEGSVISKPQALVEEEVPQVGSLKGQKSVDEEEVDPAMDALLKRVQKQRSVLEEILDKEGEKKVEAIPQIIGKDMDDRKIYESLYTTYEVRATGIPRPEAKWYHDDKEIKSSDRVKISDSGESYKLELKDVVLEDKGTYKL